MRRYLLSALAVCCMLAHARAQAAPGEHLTLCFERQEVRPWRTLDGGGLNFELLAEVAKRTGVTFDYQSMPWKRCLEQLKANQVGGAFAVSFNRERMALGAYPGVAPGASDPRVDASKRMHLDTYMLVRPRGSRLEPGPRHAFRPRRAGRLLCAGGGIRRHRAGVCGRGRTRRGLVRSHHGG